MFESVLVDFGFYFLYTLFSLIAILLFLKRDVFKGILSRINRSTWYVLLFLVFFSLFLRLFLSPMYIVNYSNAWEYMAAAKNLLYNHAFTVCSFGSVGECYSQITPPHPPGSAFFLALGSMFFGLSRNLHLGLNIMAGSLTPVMAFLFIYLLFKNEKLAVFSSFLFSLIPFHIFNSGYGGGYALASFWIFLSLFSFMAFLRKKEALLGFLTVAIVIFTSFIRIENLFLLVIFPVSIPILNRKKKENAKLLKIFLLSILVLFPLLTVQTFSLENTTCGYDFSFAYVGRNVFFMADILSETFTVPFIFISMAIVLFFFFQKKNYRREMIFLLLISLSYAGIYLTYFNHFNPDYALNITAPFILLLSFGIFEMRKMFPRKFEKAFLLSAVFVLFVLFLHGNLLPYKRMEPYVYDGERASENIMEFVEELPEDSFVSASFSEVLMIESLTERKVVMASLLPGKYNIIENKKIYWIKSKLSDISNDSEKVEGFFELRLLKEKNGTKIYEVLGPMEGI